MALIYTKADLEALASQLECCAADKAYEALKKEMFGSKAWNCAFNDYMFVKRAAKIIANYYPNGTEVTEERGDFGVEATIPGPTGYSFSHAVTVKDTGSVLDGYTFALYKSGSDVKILVVSNGVALLTIDSNDYTPPFVVNGNSVAYDKDLGLLLIGQNQRGTKLNDDYPTFTADSQTYLGANPKNTDLIYNYFDGYYYSTGDSASTSIFKIKADDLTDITPIAIGGQTTYIELNTYNGSMWIVEGNEIHNLTIGGVLTLAVSVAGATYTRPHYIPSIGKYMVGVNTPTENYVSLYNTDGTVYAGKFYTSTSNINEVFYHQDSDSYFIACVDKLVVFNKQTMSIITTSNIQYDHLNDKILVISGATTQLNQPLIHTPAQAIWYNLIGDNTTGLEQASDFVLVDGHQLYDGVIEVLTLDIDTDSYPVTAGFDSFSNMCLVVDNFLSLNATDVDLTGIGSSQCIIQEITTNNGGSAKNGLPVSATLSVNYAFFQSDFGANDPVFGGTGYFSPANFGAADVISIESFTKDDGINPPVVYTFSPPLDIFDQNAVIDGFAAAMDDGVNPVTGFGVNRVRYNIIDSNPATFTAELVFLMTELSKTNPASYITINCVGPSTVNIPFVLMPGTSGAGQIGNNRFVINSGPDVGTLSGGSFNTTNDSFNVPWTCVIDNCKGGDPIIAINIDGVETLFPAGYTLDTPTIGSWLTSTTGINFTSVWNATNETLTVTKTSYDNTDHPRYITWRRENALYDNVYSVFAQPTSQVTPNPFLVTNYGKVITIVNPSSPLYGHEIVFKYDGVVAPFELIVEDYFDGTLISSSVIYTYVNTGVSAYRNFSVNYDMLTDTFVILIIDQPTSSGSCSPVINTLDNTLLVFTPIATLSLGASSYNPYMEPFRNTAVSTSYGDVYFSILGDTAPSGLRETHFHLIRVNLTYALADVPYSLMLSGTLYNLTTLHSAAITYDPINNYIWSAWDSTTMGASTADSLFAIDVGDFYSTASPNVWTMVQSIDTTTLKPGYALSASNNSGQLNICFFNQTVFFEMSSVGIYVSMFGLDVTDFTFTTEGWGTTIVTNSFTGGGLHALSNNTLISESYFFENAGFVLTPTGNPKVGAYIGALPFGYNSGAGSIEWNPVILKWVVVGSVYNYAYTGIIYYSGSVFSNNAQSRQDDGFLPVAETENVIRVLSSEAVISESSAQCLTEEQITAVIEEAKRLCCDCCAPTNVQDINPDPLIISPPAPVVNLYKIYYGNSDQTSLTNTQVQALSNQVNRSNFTGVFNYVAEAGTYKYFAYPALWGTPSRFRDIIGGFDVVMATPFSVVINGITYTVYRSFNMLGGAQSMEVQA